MTITAAEKVDLVPVDMAWRGIELCRADRWQEGLYWLGLTAESTCQTSELPSQFFAYLGYGLVRYQGESDQGLTLCRRAVGLDFYEAENYELLARAWLVTGDRRSAVQTVVRGLQVDAAHAGLLRLRNELGQRRRPVIPFLSRRHVLNRTLGRWRHRLLSRRVSTRSE